MNATIWIVVVLVGLYVFLSVRLLKDVLQTGLYEEPEIDDIEL